MSDKIKHNYVNKLSITSELKKHDLFRKKMNVVKRIDDPSSSYIPCKNKYEDSHEPLSRKTQKIAPSVERNFKLMETPTNDISVIQNENMIYPMKNTIMTPYSNLASLDKPLQDKNNLKHKTHAIEESRARRELEYLKMNAKGLNKYYKLINKIGEGTFSTVYKASDLRRDLYDNKQWETNLFMNPKEVEETKLIKKVMHQYVAVKHIYSTSSPKRITNEVKHLLSLRGSPCISPLITAFRENKDVFLIMPYIPHDDFKKTFRSMSLDDIECYMLSLLTAMRYVHQKKIIHRDIKPSNFLYSNQKKIGYLIDFGLCEVEGEYAHKRKDIIPTNNKNVLQLIKPSDNNIKGYIKNDPRKAIVTNRAGTRGYRAPEVLLRVDHQTTAIDIWSVGSIMISFLMGKYPYFVSNDEADSMIEMTQLFGLSEMKSLATELGRSFDTNIPGLPDKRIDFMAECHRQNKDIISKWDPSKFKEAVDLAVKMIEPNPKNRLTAEQALDHPFFRKQA